MSVYAECQDIWSEYLDPYYYDGDYDPDFLSRVRSKAESKIRQYVKEYYPDNPYTFCDSCKQASPYTTITYDSGLKVDVCIVCGFGVEPNKGKA